MRTANWTFRRLPKRKPVPEAEDLTFDDDDDPVKKETRHCKYSNEKVKVHRDNAKDGKGTQARAAGNKKVTRVGRDNFDFKYMSSISDDSSAYCVRVTFIRHARNAMVV